MQFALSCHASRRGCVRQPHIHVRSLRNHYLVVHYDRHIQRGVKDFPGLVHLGIHTIDHADGYRRARRDSYLLGLRRRWGRRRWWWWWSGAGRWLRYGRSRQWLVRRRLILILRRRRRILGDLGQLFLCLSLFSAFFAR